MHCGYTLDDVPLRLPWRALKAFVRHCDEHSALFRSMHPEYGGWSYQEALLADVFDATMQVARTVAALSGKRPKQVPAHTRPWTKGNTRRYGRGAVTVAAFHEFWGGD